MLLVHADPVFTGRVFFYRDLGITVRPVLAEAFAANDAGFAPFWTHALSNGRPLLANPNYALLAPLSVLYRILPFDAAFNLFLVLHVALAGCAMLFLARRLGCSAEAAFAAGAAYALGGGLVSAMAFYWTVVAMAWAPFVIAAAIAAVAVPSARRLALLALALGMQALGGQPEPIAATIVIGAVVSLVASSGTIVARARRTLLAWALGCCGGFALAAPQLVPAALHARTTIRSLGFTADGLLFNSLHPLRALWLVVPGLGGNPIRALEPGGFPGAKLLDGPTPYLLSIYLGFVAVLLAALGAWRVDERRRRVAYALAALGVLGVVLALGRYLPGAESAAKALPFPIPFRFPEKALFLTFLALPPLAAFGVEALARLRLPGLPLLLAAAVVLDLALAQRGYMPTMDPRDLVAPPLARELSQRARALGVPDGAWRIHHERQRTSGGWGPPQGSLPPTEEDFYRWQVRMLAPPTAAPCGIPAAMELEGDHLEDTRYFALTRAAYTGPAQALPLALGEASVLWLVSPRADLEASTGGLFVRAMVLGTAQGVPEGSGYVYRNTRFLPRVRVTTDASAIPPQTLRDAASGAQRRYADASTWPQTTLVEHDGGLPLPAPAAGDAGRVERIQDDSRGATFVLSADRAALVAISDAATDLRGWSATVDGQPAPLWRANYAYLAVPVDPGQHEIRLTQRPRGWGVAWAATAAALLGAALALRTPGARRSTAAASLQGPADQRLT